MTPSRTGARPDTPSSSCPVGCNQTIEAGPGDMVHIPAGPAHRHIASALGDAPACYFLTEFG
jgi:hypothetical protein